MSTLDTSFLKKQSKIYLLVSLLCIIFAIIYESFSHNVYSVYMIFAFIIPLFLGWLISFIMYKRKMKVRRLGINLHNAGVATLTVGSIFQGVLEIYGTTNVKVLIYLIVGLLLIFNSFTIDTLRGL